MPLITPEEAWRLLADGLGPQPSETTARRSAAGRVLAQPIRATVDLPPCDVSAMDGYVVSRPVLAGSTMPVSGTIAAGDGPGWILAAETAARIMTGAPVPEGAEAVVPVEQTNGGEETVTFSAPSRTSAHIRRHGEVVRRGDEILVPGTAITPTVLGLLASHGVRDVSVYRAPRVATLSTGDEILSPDQEPGPGQLRDSHTDYLLAAGAALNLEFEALGIARDDEADLARHIEAGLRHDVLLISGGVSKGLFDLVEDVLAQHGCRTIFDAVAVQPGKPLVAARHDAGWVFGLPGNPASAIVCFQLFVRPFLRTLMGFEDGYWHGALRGELEAPLPAARGRTRFLSASLRVKEGRILVTPHPPHGSHDVVAYGKGSALVRVPAHSEAAAAGDSCEILPL